MKDLDCVYKKHTFALAFEEQTSFGAQEKEFFDKIYITDEVVQEAG